MRSRPWLLAAVASGATFAALAALVARGRLQSLDQYAVDHWMRKFEPRTEPAPMLTWHQLYPRLGDPVESFFDIWSFPASPHISGLLVAGGALVLARRGRPTAGVAWIAAWVCANAVEVVLKQTLERPLLRTMVGGREVSFR